MNPWFAALIPLGIIAVLGPLAFYLGYRSHQRDMAAAGTELIDDSSGQESATFTQAQTQQQNELRAVITSSDRLILRAVNERATLVHFVDLTSSHSSKVQGVFRELHREFGAHVTFVMRHSPAARDGLRVAGVLEAADYQGKSFDLLDRVFEGDRDTLTSSHETVAATNMLERLLGVARALGLDMLRLEADAISSATLDAVESDRKQALVMGVRRAPTLLFLDGQDRSFSSLEELRAAVAEVARRKPGFDGEANSQA